LQQIAAFAAGTEADVAKPVRHRGKSRIRWVDENGRRQSEVHDDYKTAQLHQSRHQHEAEEIRRGLRTARPRDRVFSELCDYWIENRAPLKRSGKDDESIIRVHLRPAFGMLLLRELRQEHVDPYIRAKGNLDAKTVANTLTLLITMMNTAKDDLGWIERVPKVRKPRFRPPDFHYLRTADEVQRFLRAARDEGESVFALYSAAVFTGMRAGEIAALSWSDVDLDRRLITVQRSYAGPTKSGDVRYVPLLDPLHQQLREWRLRHPGKLVFTNESGRMHGPSARVFQEVLHRVLDRAGFPIERQGPRVRRYITFHDLRHTFASHWMMFGGELFKLRAVLGHKSIDMTMRYAHLAPHAFATDHQRLGNLAPVPRAEVVSLASQRR